MGFFRFPAGAQFSPHSPNGYGYSYNTQGLPVGYTAGQVTVDGHVYVDPAQQAVIRNTEEIDLGMLLYDCYCSLLPDYDVGQYQNFDSLFSRLMLL